MPDSPRPARPLAAVELIADAPRLTEFLSVAGRAPLLAVDTEAASFHRYLDRVYLLQLSTREETAVVDPLAVGSLEAFGRILADPVVEIVFHDADYDLRLLHREFGFRATNLFDTRVAAQLLNEPGIGLAALLLKHFGVTLDKRFQRADWSNRPLTDPMLRYAASDTHYLPELRDILRDRLIEMGRLAWAEEEFALMEAVEWGGDGEQEEAWLKPKGVKALKPRQLAVYRAVHRWRDALAERLDKAPFRVMNNEPLLELARVQPRSAAELGAIRGIGRDIVGRRSEDLLQAIEEALALRDDELPRRPRFPRRPPDDAYDARLERLKAARNDEAERVGLAPGLLAPNSILEGIARLQPASVDDLAEVPGMRRWQRDAIGERLVREVSSP